MLSTETTDLHPGHTHAAPGAAVTVESGPKLPASCCPSWGWSEEKVGRCGWGGSGAGALECPGRMEREGGRSREAGPAPGLGEVQEGWQSGHLGSCPSSPLAPHLRRPAGPLTLTSKTHPQASLSSVPVQAIVSLMGASAPTSVLSLGSRALSLTSYSPVFTQQVGEASSLPSLTAWNEFWPPAP